MAAVEAFRAAVQAAHGPDIAVELDDVGGTGEVVKPVDVLGDQREDGLGSFQVTEGEAAQARGLVGQFQTVFAPFPVVPPPSVVP